MNRIDQAMKDWQERQTKYVGRYGEDLLKDREFAKVKLKAFKRCLRETRGLNLTSEEKDDRNILKSQINHLEKTITPNPMLRFAKKAMERLQDFAVIAWGVGMMVRESLRNKQNEGPYTANVLNAKDPDFTTNNLEKNNSKEESQSYGSSQQNTRKHAQSTPLPGDLNSKKNDSEIQANENRLQTRKNQKQGTNGKDLEPENVVLKKDRKQRVVTENTNKGVRI